MTDNEELVDLAGAMVDAFVNEGKGVLAVVPEGRREDVVRACVRLLTEAGALNAYLAAIEDARKRRGIRLRISPLYEGWEAQTVQIIVTAMSDDELAGFAFAPSSRITPVR